MKEQAKILGTFDELPFSPNASQQPPGLSRQALQLAMAEPGKWVVIELTRGIKAVCSRRSSLSLLAKNEGLEIETRSNAEKTQLALRVKP
jgi:hypothetical protein